MDKKEMIYAAKMAIQKGMDKETLKYSDYLYGHESSIDDVWEYVLQAKEQGSLWFERTYAEYLQL